MPLFRTILFTALVGAATAVSAHGQAAPTATAPDPYGGFAIPTVNGSLRYSLTASETVLTGYNGATGNGARTYTSLGGNLAYLSKSKRRPFSAVYSGGYLIGGSTFPSYPYQSLALSQALPFGKWSFTVADVVDYTPQTPIGSLSGIPGIGDLSVTPVPVVPSIGLGILTTYATRIGNTVSGAASRQLTGATSLGFSGTYSIQRYTGTSTGFQGINNDSKSVGASLQHRLNARSSVGAAYNYISSGFQSGLLGTGTHGFQSHSVLGTYSRQLTRRLFVTAGAGPQWVPGGTGATTQATSVSIAANAGLAYTVRQYSANLSYVRGVSNGNGVVIGSQTDAVSGSLSKRFARIFSASGLVGYNHSQQLSNSALPNYSSSGVVAGGQVSAQVRQPLSVFAGYTLQRQSFNGYAPAGIAFNGLTQFVSFGVTFSPKPFYDRK